jgi:hypothetical protein
MATIVVSQDRRNQFLELGRSGRDPNLKHYLNCLRRGRRRGGRKHVAFVDILLSAATGERWCWFCWRNVQVTNLKVTAKSTRRTMGRSCTASCIKTTDLPDGGRYLNLRGQSLRGAVLKLAPFELINTYSCAASYQPMYSDITIACASIHNLLLFLNLISFAVSGKAFIYFY